MPDGPRNAQDPDEPFDIVRADGTPTGRRKPRAAVHRDGDWHRSVHIWIAGIDDQGEPSLTFQRRSPRKDTWPNRYDATVAGHYRAGETLAETLREAEEEIGIVVAESMLRPLGIRVCANESEAGIIDREIQDVLLWPDNRPLTAFAPNPDELAALARFPLSTLIPFLASDAAAVSGQAVTPGAAFTAPVVARFEEFIPNVDRYFLRAALAAAAALRGERYAAV